MAGKTTPSPDQLEQARRKLAAQQHLIDKLKTIRALHVMTYNSQTKVEDMAPEFYYAIGDILEGIPAKDLRLSIINKEEFLKELEDGT